MSQPNLPHGKQLKRVKQKKIKTDMLRSNTEQKPEEKKERLQCLRFNYPLLVGPLQCGGQL